MDLKDRIMGLDYGSKTIGVAISDSLGLTAQPFETIERDKENKLRRSLARIAKIVEENNIKEIAIPAISTGVFGFPKDEAAKIALKTVIENQDGFEKIIFAVYEEKDKEYYERELEKVKRNNK